MNGNRAISNLGCGVGRISAVFALVFLQAFVGSALAQERDIWRHMLHTENLAEPLDAEILHFSSWARNGSNSDLGWYYGTDSHGWKIICDIQGPGVITDFWWHKDPFSMDWRWRIYVDDTTNAIIDTSIRLLTGSVPPFEPPLADSSSNGYFSYVPIPFQSRVRITLNPQVSIYYHVSAHCYPPGTIVESFTIPPSAEYLACLDSLRQRYLNPAVPIYLDEPDAFTGGTELLQPDSSVSWTVVGSGMTRRVLLKPTNRSRQTLENFWVRIFTDGYPLPDLEGPISALFAQPLGWHNYASILTGTSADTAYLNLPIHYRSSLRYELINRTGVVQPIGAWIETIEQPLAELPPFSARGIYSEEDPTIAWRDFEFFNLAGPGNYVGTLYDTQQNDPHVLEGDEKFWIDGEANPTWHGTGTEDYFKGGRYWWPAYAQLPLHGCIAYLGDSAAAYHWHLNDAIPFDSSLRASTEVGRFGQMTGHYRAMAFAYASRPQWTVLDAGGDNSSSPGEEIRIIGKSLSPTSLVSLILLGDIPVTIAIGSSEINADSILDVCVLAPDTLPTGIYALTALVGETPVTIDSSWQHYTTPVLSFNPLRLDVDTCVFAGDTIEISGHGFPPNVSPDIVAASTQLLWVLPIPSTDALGRLSGRAIVPEDLEYGDHQVTALLDDSTIAECEIPLKNREFYRMEVEVLEKTDGLRFREEWVYDYANPLPDYPWGRDCLRMLQGTGIGSFSVLEFYYPLSGWCRPEYFWAVCNAAAIARTTIDTVIDLSSHDTFQSTPYGKWHRSDTTRGDTIYLEAGWHTLRVEIVGRHQNANGWNIMLDQFNLVTVVPEPPNPVIPDRVRDLTIQVQDSAVMLCWSHVRADTSGNPLQPDGYRIYRSPSLDSLFNSIGDVSGSDSTYFDSISFDEASPATMFYQVIAWSGEPAIQSALPAVLPQSPVLRRDKTRVGKSQ